MRVRNRFARVDLLVDPAVDEEYRLIIFSQGESASSDYRKYQREVIVKHMEHKEWAKSNPNLHISPDEINETLDKWLIDAKLRSEDGTIEELRGITKRTSHYTNMVNSHLLTQQKREEEERKNKALLESTNTDKRLRQLEEENRLLREEREREREKTKSESHDLKEEALAEVRNSD